MDYVLSIDGPATTIYSATCRVGVEGGEWNASFDGSPPIQRVFTGNRLDCRIRQKSSGGFLAVEIRRGGSISRWRTEGAGSTIILSLR
ncbi:MAG: hypothetical protein M0006_06370 [Magnetospirillum sp.]|nr:hypothetical protein [Magnetospirillum sp.]